MKFFWEFLWVLFGLPCYSAGSWVEMSQKGGGWHARRLLARTSKFTQKRSARANARPNTDFALKIDQTKVSKRQIYQLMIKVSLRHAEKISKIRDILNKKLFYHHFSSFFLDFLHSHKNQWWPCRWIKEIEKKLYILLRFFNRIFLIKIFWRYTRRGL